MLKNNNKDVIRLLNRRMIKCNRLRNVVTIIAIVLTTFMFTTIFSIGYSLANNVNDILLLGQGSRASVFLTHPTEQQIEAVKQCTTVRAAGLRIKVEKLTDKKEKNKYNLMWFDETEYEQNLKPAIRDVIGTYPQNQNEIMMSTSHLLSLGYEQYHIGDMITLYKEGVPTDFVLTGYYSGYSSSNPCLISQAYVIASGKNVSDDGYMAISSKAGNNESMLEQLENSVSLDEGQCWDNVYDVQKEKVQTIVSMIIAMCLISLLVVVSGYLLIYNVMYISVAKDTRFYGLLKLVGTTSKQIKKIVRLQSVYLSAIGIPLGLLLGTLTSFGIVPIASNMISAGRSELISTDVTFNVYIYAFAIAFAAITVFFSMMKPAKMASKVSPIEALRYYSENQQKSATFGAKRTDKECSEGEKIRTMAWRNVFRDRKRARLVFASLFFGSIVFLCINTFIKSVSVDNFLASYFYYDYAVYINEDMNAMQVVYDYGDEYDTTGGKSFEQIADEITSLDGLEYYHINRYAHGQLDYDINTYRPFLEYAVERFGATDVEELDALFTEENEDSLAFGASVVSVDSRMIETYNKKAKHKIDIDRFERGEICLVGYVLTDEQSESFTGKEISITNEVTGEEKTIEVGATAVYGENYGIIAGYYWSIVGAPQMILVSDSFMDELFPDAAANTIVADAKKDREPELATIIYQMYKSNDCIGALDIESMESEDFRKSMMSLSIVGGGISGILILIGLMNFVNVMITSVYTRSKEIATLESVGMTKKQQKHMLIWEGFIYGGISIGLLLTIGSIMIYGMGELTEKIADYAIPEYPVVALLFLSVMIIIICLVTPILIFNDITKRTVTERIRE